ncbi:two component transcriptional regulator, LuxR family [Ancylobacter novellus DSM 506]|uniref:Two component transcriptional regulator, LuxR family n=1 Tax=Ancylobacter novellus (strain ATCC 8093 / DSM 506 / JCM 20403 / CCM 1077 / IAM 12100 / NBRC 12443 / NCIMB 10456) TaxID=639283 RepID=D7A1M9_ANCN5|nr:response regulator transcription factor [Ancylobacter novellus]ADH91454.1 two component transcriptional regulator, LuxR family [Ancylobacter novellus DSM 506]
MTSVLVIDDHPIVLQGCRRLLEDAGVEKVLEASTLLTGYRLFRREKPDVVIVDLSLQGNGLSGLMLVQRLRAQSAHTPILVFSMHGDPVIASRALEAGANGYVLKDTSSSVLMEAFERVRRGQPYMSHDLAMQVALLGTRKATPLADITPRELQTLSLLAEGKDYTNIAAELGVSYKTVANTCSALKSKLGANSLPELVRRSIQYLSTSPVSAVGRSPTGRLS